MITSDQTPEGSNTGTARQIHIVDAEQAWDAVDALPPAFRALLHTAPFDIDAIEILDFLHQGRRMGWPDANLLSEVRKQLSLSVLTCADEWGPGYPATRFSPIMPRPRRPCRRLRQILR